MIPTEVAALLAFGAFALGVGYGVLLGFTVASAPDPLPDPSRLPLEASHAVKAPS